MYFHLDNFTAYDTVRTTGTVDTTWLSKAYQLVQSAVTNLRLQEWSTGRVGLGTVAAFTGTRSVYLPLGGYLGVNQTMNITMRLLDYTPNNVAIAGLSLVSEGQDNHLISFGFVDKSTGFVVYVNKEGVVQRDVFLMKTRLSGLQDVVEWGFIKSTNSRDVYRPFTIWVNNKSVYMGEVLSQFGNSSNMSARILGGVPTLAAGTASPSGFVNGSGNVTVPICGLTDLVVNDGARNGSVRVLSRQPSVDLGPNDMAQTGLANSHAELVGAIPTDANKYLTAVTATMSEMYGAQAFPDLSSEAILAFGLQVVAAKNNPFALDLAANIKQSGTVYQGGLLNLDLVPSYSQVILDKNPATNLRWTALEANSANFGIGVL